MQFALKFTFLGMQTRTAFLTAAACAGLAAALAAADAND
jgi:hypothetical protein